MKPHSDFDCGAFSSGLLLPQHLTEVSDRVNVVLIAVTERGHIVAIVGHTEFAVSVRQASDSPGRSAPSNSVKRKCAGRLAKNEQHTAVLHPSDALSIRAGVAADLGKTAGIEIYSSHNHRVERGIYPCDRQGSRVA